jgi:hypothetical protein
LFIAIGDCPEFSVSDNDAHNANEAVIQIINLGDVNSILHKMDGTIWVHFQGFGMACLWLSFHGRLWVRQGAHQVISGQL